MDLRIVDFDGHKIVEGQPGQPLLTAPNDIIDILGTCFEHHTRSVLLYAENLTPNFFDLSSGEAGAILQKLRNYHIKLAIVAPPDLHQSTLFPDMLREESQSGYLTISPDKPSAELWLSDN